jgi:hypothetical protein
MSQMMTVLATSLLATSLLTAAAEARGGGQIGSFDGSNVYCRCKGDPASFTRIDRSPRPSFDRSDPASDPDYYAACDETWVPKAFWASSCK